MNPRIPLKEFLRTYFSKDQKKKLDAFIASKSEYKNIDIMSLAFLEKGLWYKMNPSGQTVEYHFNTEVSKLRISTDEYFVVKEWFNKGNNLNPEEIFGNVS